MSIFSLDASSWVFVLIDSFFFGSKSMSKKMYGHAYGADKSMSYRHVAKVVKHKF